MVAGLQPGRHSHQGIVEVIDEPHASKRDNAGQHDMRQSPHQHAKQIREGGQYRRTCKQQFAAYPVKRPDHCRQDQDQKKLLPQRPLLPWRARQSADLIDRPAPDQFDEAEDRRNSLMQKCLKLIENLFHNQILSRIHLECKEGASGSQNQARALNHLARSCNFAGCQQAIPSDPAHRASLISH